MRAGQRRLPALLATACLLRVSLAEQPFLSMISSGLATGRVGGNVRPRQRGFALQCRGGRASDPQARELRNAAIGRAGTDTTYTFEMLREVVAKAELDEHGRPSLEDALGRRPEQQEVYRAFRRSNIEGKWVSTGEFLMNRIFGWERVQDGESGLFRCRRPAQDAERVVLLTDNDFPYNLEGGTHHYVLWASSGILSVDEVRACCRRLERERPCESVWWVNAPRLKSVPEIDHCHIVVKYVS